MKVKLNNRESSSPAIQLSSRTCLFCFSKFYKWKIKLKFKILILVVLTWPRVRNELSFSRLPVFNAWTLNKYLHWLLYRESVSRADWDPPRRDHLPQLQRHHPRRSRHPVPVQWRYHKLLAHHSRNTPNLSLSCSLSLIFEYLETGSLAYKW